MSENSHKINEVLNSVDQNRYGENYQSHYMTLYSDYVSSADSISSRRNSANSFFLSINTAYFGVTGYFKPENNEFVWVQAAVGVLFCLVWWKLIQSYRTLNTAKFAVIQQMEKNLPLAAFTAEELAYQTGSTVHRALSSVESYVPALFGTLHLVAAILNFG
jgi:hypothetical protein